MGRAFAAAIRFGRPTPARPVPPKCERRRRGPKTGAVTASAARAGPQIRRRPGRRRRPSIASQLDNRPAFTVGDLLARESRHLDEAGQRTARYRHLDPRLQRAQRLRHPQPRGVGGRLSGGADGRAVAHRLIDPRAYGGWTSSAGPHRRCYGNWTGGALNFRTRPGGKIDGFDTGSTAAATAISTTIWRSAANREVRCFAVCERHARRQLYRQRLVRHPDPQLPRRRSPATPDDTFTVKLINNELRRGCRSGFAEPVLSKPFPGRLPDWRRRRAGCGTVTLFNNGIYGPPEH